MSSVPLHVIELPSASLENGGGFDSLADWLRRTNNVDKQSFPAGITQYAFAYPGTAYPDFAQVKAVVAGGGEYLNFKCWFAIAAVDYDTVEVPEFFTNAIALDAGDPPLEYTRTWKQWVDAAGTFVPTPLSDGRLAIPGDAHGLMPGSVLAQLTNECEVLNTFQVKSLLPAE